jgi:glycogen synthase
LPGLWILAAGCPFARACIPSPRTFSLSPSVTVAEEGTGWTFSPATLDALAGAVAAAVRCYRSSPAAWGAVVRRGMAADHSWEGAAEQYEKVLLGAKERRLAAAV